MAAACSPTLWHQGASADDHSGISDVERRNGLGQNISSSFLSLLLPWTSISYFCIHAFDAAFPESEPEFSPLVARGSVHYKRTTQHGGPATVSRFHSMVREYVHASCPSLAWTHDAHGRRTSQFRGPSQQRERPAFFCRCIWSQLSTSGSLGFGPHGVVGV